MTAIAVAPFVLSAGPRAFAQDELPPFPDGDVQILRAGDQGYEQHQPSYNARTMLRPRWRALCKSMTGLRRLVDAARDRRIPFAIRSGGHSFEGFSQSDTLVIDVRPLNNVQISPGASGPIAVVGSGISLGALYRATARAGLCFPAGSCPTVGLAGHMQGGGFGLLSRALGLASDAFLGAEIVDAQGAPRVVSAEKDPDLYWALQGGGGGTFGAASSFRIALFQIGQVHTFTQSFSLPIAAAVQVVDAWQNWAPAAPDEISSLLTVRSTARGITNLRLAGQSVGNATTLQDQLQRFAGKASQPANATIRSGSFLEAVDRFSGGWNYESKFSKGKSDYVLQPLSAQAIDTLLRGISSLSPNSMIAIMDAYGGAIQRKRNHESAFAFRNALYCIQYYSSWFDPAQTGSRLTQMRKVYAAMRPHLPGFSYVNYCDLDLTDWQHAYWSTNVDRLRNIKAHVDPTNLFHHAQSITPTIGFQ